MEKNKAKKAIASLAIVGMAMAMTMTPFNALADTGVTSARLFGSDRVGTAVAVANAGWTTADTAILAPAADANLVDALAAAPLAGKTAPILLTDNTSLTDATKVELVKLGVKNVYVVGAVSQTVVDQVKAISGVSVTVLQGADRIGTAAAISAKLTAPAGSFVVGYSALADALSVASYAAANNYSILVANPDGSLPESETAYKGANTYIIGGPTIVADIPGATRLFGVDRFATNQAVLKALTFKYDKAYVANGTDAHLVDSLVASSLAAESSAPIVLSDTTSAFAAADVHAKLAANAVVTALGGSTVVPDAVAGQVAPATAVAPVVPSETSNVTISNLTVAGQTAGAGTLSSPAIAAVHGTIDISATISGANVTNPGGVTYLVSDSANLTATGNGQTLVPTTLNTPIIIGNDSFNATYIVTADANGTAKISFTSTASLQQPFNVVAQAPSFNGTTSARSNEVHVQWEVPEPVLKDPHTITVTSLDNFGKPLANQSIYLQTSGLLGMWITQVNGQTLSSAVNMGTEMQTTNTPVPLFVYSAQSGNETPAYSVVSSQWITAYDLTTAPVVSLRTGEDGTVSITLQSENVSYPSLNPDDPTAVRDYFVDAGSATASGNLIFTSGKTQTSTNVLGTIPFKW
ncbi:MAG: cell wall-binding repeat-containing protein [Desulfosporosinus sp.]|nr:cell wall-binding repeat-containing protein [Desulfosporosinus sp.]